MTALDLFEGAVWLLGAVVYVALVKVRDGLDWVVGRGVESKEGE